MKSPQFSRSALVSALLSLAFAGALQAEVPADFTIVADSSQPAFQGRGFGTYPSINDDGTVAFVIDQDGTYRAENGQPPVRVGGSVTGDPFINRSGEIGSRQYTGSMITELYKAQPGGSIVPLVRNDTEFRSFGTPLHLSSNGTAVFWARKNPVSPGHWGIWTENGDGNTPNLVVDNKGMFSNFGMSPTINASGRVAFAGAKDVVNNTSETGLYTGAGGGDATVTTVLTAAGSPLYNFDSGPYINDRGQIAFMAYEDSTGEPGIFVVNQDGTGVQTIARAGGIGGTGAYSMFTSPMINEIGTVVFRAWLDTGGSGIYAGPDPVRDKIIQEGDPLFGSTATSVVFLRGLNNRNEIAFYFTLADGRSGIAKARLKFVPGQAMAPFYHLTDLGLPPGQQRFSPTAINNQGQVAGSSEFSAYRYTNGVWENLGKLPGGNVSGALALNNNGDAAGRSQFENGGALQHATLYTGGTVTDLGTLPQWGNNSTAAGINDSRQIVGYSGPSLSSTNTHAFIWDAANGMRDLGSLGGEYAKAFSINNDGIVTGTAQIPTGFGNFHAFVWDAANGMRDIGTIAGDSSTGYFINADGHVVGGSTINNFDNRSHAFLYDGTMHDLGSLGPNAFESDRSAALGINVYDEVVGSSYRPYTGGALYQVAFVYRSGSMFDLEDRVDNKNYRLYSAVSINDHGQILVQAIHVPTNTNRAVVLSPSQPVTQTPTPTPSPTPTATPTATPAPTPTATPTAVPVASPTPMPTATATPTAVPVASPTATATATATPTSTPTSTPTATPTATIAPSPTPSPVGVTSRPLNIATRGRVESGENAMIGGFIIRGNAPKKVIVRAIGPSLQAMLPGALSDPLLALRGADGSLILQNDNWQDDAVQAAEIEANGVAPSNDREAAVIVTLVPGNYTAAVTGRNGATGVGLVEVYDVGQAANSQLANISTRGVIQSGANVLIGGFILGGSDNIAKVLVRAMGPSLAAFGINNALSDPTLELYDGNGVLLASNDNWTSQQFQVEATGLQPANDAEAAIVADLPPGLYTAVVASKGANGIGLIEIYNLK